MMEEGGIEGHFRNHSTRKSTCTRLFQEGVDPQLIKEQTGHKSEAVMRYKKSNLAIKKQVSDMFMLISIEIQFYSIKMAFCLLAINTTMMSRGHSENKMSSNNNGTSRCE